MTNQGQTYAAGATNAIYSPPKEIKSTAVDSINASIESLTLRANALCSVAARIADGLIGVRPENASVEGPRPVTQSTQDHVRDLEAAIERLSTQIGRLG